MESVSTLSMLPFVEPCTRVAARSLRMAVSVGGYSPIGGCDRGTGSPETAAVTDPAEGDNEPPYVMPHVRTQTSLAG